MDAPLTELSAYIMLKVNWLKNFDIIDWKPPFWSIIGPPGVQKLADVPEIIISSCQRSCPISAMVKVNWLINIDIIDRKTYLQIHISAVPPPLLV